MLIEPSAQGCPSGRLEGCGPTTGPGLSESFDISISFASADVEGGMLTLSNGGVKWEVKKTFECTQVTMNRRRKVK